MSLFFFRLIKALRATNGKENANQQGLQGNWLVVGSR